MKKSIVMGLGVAVLGSTFALANEPYFPRQERMFNNLDTNKNGRVEKDEFQIFADRRIARVDLNKDKILTVQEIDDGLKRAIERRRNRMLQGLDHDKNGAITEAELNKFADAMFTAADADKDGAVTLAEVQVFKPGPWRKSFIGSGAN